LKKNDWRILEVVSQKEGASVYDISKALQLKRTTVLYHIRKLVDIGLLVKAKKGRQNAYRLVDKATAHNILHQYEVDLSKRFDTIWKSAINQSTATQNKKKKILSFINYFDLLPDVRKQLELYYEIRDFSNKNIFISLDELEFRARDAEVIVNHAGCRIDNTVLSYIPSVRYIHAPIENISFLDIDALRDAGIAVSHISDTYYYVSATVEFIIASTYALLRQVVRSAKQVETGVYTYQYFLGDQLRGKRAGIVGLNSITYELVNTLRNLGVSVQVCDCGVSQDTNLKPYDLGISEFVSQKQLLAQSDVVYIVDGKVTDLDSTFLNKIEKPIYLISTVRHKKVNTKTFLSPLMG